MQMRRGDLYPDCVVRKPATDCQSTCPNLPVNFMRLYLDHSIERHEAAILTGDAAYLARRMGKLIGAVEMFAWLSSIIISAFVLSWIAYRVIYKPKSPVCTNY